MFFSSSTMHWKKKTSKACTVAQFIQKSKIPVLMTRQQYLACPFVWFIHKFMNKVGRNRAIRSAHFPALSMHQSPRSVSPSPPCTRSHIPGDAPGLCPSTMSDVLSLPLCTLLGGPVGEEAWLQSPNGTLQTNACRGVGWAEPLLKDQ